jgi:hypothetical protein
MDIIHGMFAPEPQGKGFDYSGFEEEPSRLLEPTANYILGLKDDKLRPRSSWLCSRLRFCQMDGRGDKTTARALLPVTCPQG